MKRLSLRDVDLPKGLPPVSLQVHPYVYEIAISLFDKCNLRCRFCYQAHKQDIDLDFINRAAKTMFDSTYADIEKYKDTLKRINLLFMGGELFSDDISDDILEAYKRMWLDARKYYEDYFGIPVYMLVSTNGVWTKRDRIIELLRESKIDNVNLSYDPVGRFPSESALNTFYDTIKCIHNEGFTTTISYVTTKSNIDLVLKEPIYAEMLKSEYVTYGDLNMYICNPGWENDMPSDEDMFECYKWHLDNGLWKVNLTSLLMENYIARDKNEFMPRFCDCKFQTYFNKDGVTKDCAHKFSSYKIEDFYGKYADKLTLTNVSDVKSIMGYQKLGCSYCEHVLYCPMPCWCSVLINKYKPKLCSFKKTFNYITDVHVSSFKKWEEINNGRYTTV